MALDSPLNEALTFLRNTFAQAPRFGDKFEVINIETYGRGALLLLDLDDGTTITLTVERDARDQVDEETVQTKLAHGLARLSP